jgi:hypothetical protein
MKLSLDQEPTWIKTYGGKRRVKFLHGIKNSYENGETSVAIDAGVAEIILLLNQNKLYSNFHCSGLQEDHEYKNKNTQQIRDDSGYITFKNTKRAAKLTKYLPRIMKWHTGAGIYFKEMGTITNEDKRLGWKELEANLRELFS